ncbi:MAG: hypothetical protein GY768_17570 [Planctomycetaceae bacterium]|nr:hypothetical protein [Planctomycetaceae bacterium]
MKLIFHVFRMALVSAILIAMSLSLSAAPMVVNGDFESETEGFAVWPGYVGGDNPAQIDGWIGTGGHGINPISSDHESPAPFRDNGGNDTHVAFLQGASTLEQTVSGFVVGQDYTLTAQFNSRNCCGDFPIAEVYFNDELAGSSVDLFPPPGVIPPVGDENPWYTVNIALTAETTDIALRVQSAAGAGGDATLLVDNVSFSVVPEPCSTSLIAIGLLGLASLARRRS